LCVLEVRLLLLLLPGGARGGGGIYKGVLLGLLSDLERREAHLYSVDILFAIFG